MDVFGYKQGDVYFALTIRILKALIARLDALETDIQREQNRMEKTLIAQVTEEVSRSIESVFTHLDAEKARLLRQIDDHIDRLSCIPS